MLHVPAEQFSICTVLRGTIDLGDMTFTNLDALANVRTVEGDLNLFRNEKLVNVSALRNLKSVSGALRIHHSVLLESLEGLENLESVGELFIRSNSGLRSLAGLSKLKTVGGDLSIFLNDKLAQADAESFAAKLQVGGMRKVEGNGEGP